MIGVSLETAFFIFDRYHTFKFFLYLTDVTVDDGPFMVIPNTHLLGRELREKSWQNKGQYDVVQNRLEIDYSHLGYNKEQDRPYDWRCRNLNLVRQRRFSHGGSDKKQWGEDGYSYSLL